MDPIQNGLVKYHDFHLPPGHADYGGGSNQFVESGNMPVYSNSTVFGIKDQEVDQRNKNSQKVV